MAISIRLADIYIATVRTVVCVFLSACNPEELDFQVTEKHRNIPFFFFFQFKLYIVNICAR